MTTIPTIAQLYAGVLADLQTEFGTSIPLIGKSFLRAFAAVQAAKLKLLYLVVAKVQKNIFPDTADPEATGGTLERFGRVKINRNPHPATQAQYEVSVVGTPGSVIKAGTTFKSDDDSRSPGILYVLDADFTFTLTNEAITLRALTAGTAASLATADMLTATAPMSGVDASALVVSEIVAPVDSETTEQYRAKVLQSYRLYPQGGSSADYRLWGLEAPGVAQIYPYAASGSPNVINVFVEATIADSIDGKGKPSPQLLADVEALIEQDPVTGRGRRPLGVFDVMTMEVNVNDLTITIAGAGGISVANRALITAALVEAVNAVRPFIGGADVLTSRNDTFGINSIISTILSTVPGTQFSSVSMTVDSGSGPVVTPSRLFDNGNIPFLDPSDVTYA